jgi:hypothetical protein
MMIRLEQFIGQWITLIEIPVDDYDLPEIREVVTTLSAQLRKNQTVEITNPEAEFTILVNSQHGPIRFQVLEFESMTNDYADRESLYETA